MLIAVGASYTSRMKTFEKREHCCAQAIHPTPSIPSQATARVAFTINETSQMYDV
jgi:hypothetical protein